MDRRSWPWKKKSSEKTATGNHGDQGNSKSVSYKQITVETYAHFTKFEDQIKVLNDQVQLLSEKLSTSQSEITTKDALVKQHAKVAEEAVSGWEKAEDEALALKTQLESVTLLKLSAEDQASHLDGALKECMNQIRIVKEESEQKLHDVVLAKTKQWENVKFELETKITDSEEQLLRAFAENDALTRSLQERSNILMKVNEEKSQADAEIEILKANIQSRDREISSLKYELQIVSKEFEVRNEEKNMSVRSAEVANKQHLEDVKKITRLEAECQRLRGLVRKKLPGPAALAQMRLEVENLGQDYGDPRLRWSRAKSASPCYGPVPDFALENIQQCHKENDFLTERLLAMEEETMMLREALLKRNNELQASRNLCAKTASRLRNVEANIQVLNHQKMSSKSNIEVAIESNGSQRESNPPSLTSVTEDGVEEEENCSESSPTALLAHFNKDKGTYKSIKSDSSSCSQLMDDFLEMERLACLSTAGDTIDILDGSTPNMRVENDDANPLTDVLEAADLPEKQHHDLSPPIKLASSYEDRCNEVQLSKLQSTIVTRFETQTKDTDTGKLSEDDKHRIENVIEEMTQRALSCSVDDPPQQKHCLEDLKVVPDSDISLPSDSKQCTNAKHAHELDLKNAISQIHEHIVALCKGAMEIQGLPLEDHDIGQKVRDFSASVNEVLYNRLSMADFILALSRVLSDMKELKTKYLSSLVISEERIEGENNISDCIGKVALLDNSNVTQHAAAKESFSSDCTLVCHSASDPEIQGRPGSGSGLKDTLHGCLLDEFEQLKLEKDKLVVELASCSESLEQTKFQLLQMEQQLVEVKLELAASQKSNRLVETQLKCMTESYESLESRAQNLKAETELISLRAETLDNGLQEEKHSHHDDLAKIEVLKEQIERFKQCSKCSPPADADVEKKAKQENEIAAAAEKLAECQETIFVLGRQLKALGPREEAGSFPFERHQLSELLVDDGLNLNVSHSQGRHSSQTLDSAEMETIATTMQGMGDESPANGYDSLFSASDTEACPNPRSPISLKRPKHRSSRSSSSSSFSNITDEKHGRGFSRFFSKGKSGRKE